MCPKPGSNSALRIQLGDNDSFIAWSNTSWMCYRVPGSLQAELCQLSRTHMRSRTVTKGPLKGELSWVVWHGDGSYYVKGWQGHFWHLESNITHEAWAQLWPTKHAIPTLKELSELVLVALSPHASVGETFAFIKKQHDAQEAPFLINVYQEATSRTGTSQAERKLHDTSLQHIEQKPEQPRSFPWAIGKHDGRPHPSDLWKLELKKGRKVKVWDDKGRNWFIVEGLEGSKGWVHGTWLEFCGSKLQKDPRSSYTLFQDDMRKLLIPGQLREFPALCRYMSGCTSAACGALHDETKLSICVHSLQTLLEGSGCYSYEWLKEERNVWHPDKFARYCHSEHKEHLKSYAQHVFVLYGILMDMCQQREDSSEE